MKFRRNKKSNIIYVEFKGENGRVSMSTRTRDMAKAKALVEEMGIEKIERLAEVNAMSAGAIQLAISGRKITGKRALADWESYLRRVARSTRTIEEHTATVRVFLKQQNLNTRPISVVTEGHVDDFINDPQSRIGASTRKRYLTAVRRFLEFCAAKKYILGNPAAIVPVKYENLTHRQKEPRKTKAFTPHEIRKMIASLEGEWVSAVILSLEAGLRLGDICTLEWDTFDTEPGRIVVWTDKRDKRVSLPMTERLQLIKSGPRTSKRWVLPELAKAYRASPSSVSVYFGRELRKLGIEGKSFQSLRATFAQTWRGYGKTVDEIREALGHDDEATTKKHYLGEG